MPAHTPCPISEVDRALSSYIHSREETLKIRRTLSKYLVSSLRPVSSATQNQHLNHVCPQNLSAVNTNPPGLTDSRLDYLHALRARHLAQVKHRELQASLDELRSRYVDENPMQPLSEYDNEVTRSYVTLLRQRRRLAELHVIQDALDRLLSAKVSDTAMDLKALVKDAIGEQPNLPAERLELPSQTDDDQTWIFKLKQEVLEAKASMETAQAAREKAQSSARGSATLQAQVHALELAREEIVEWVQGELSKLEEDSVFIEDASPVKRTPNTAPPVDISSAEAQIRASYDAYTAARARTLASHTSLHQPPSARTEDETENKLSELNPSTPDSSTPPISTTLLLPHLPHLTHTTTFSRALVHQSIYLETQLASADQDIEDALLRLSGESHLLPAGSKDVSAWGKTAREAEAATERVVQGCLEGSERELRSVGAVVELCSLQGRVLGEV